MHRAGIAAAAEMVDRLALPWHVRVDNPALRFPVKTDANYSSGPRAKSQNVFCNATSGFTRCGDFAHNRVWCICLAPMSDSSFHTSAPMHGLLARELAATASILGGAYGNFGMIVRPHAGAPMQLPAHLLGSTVHLALDATQCLRGAVTCAPGALPFAPDSFMLVIAQHVLEQVDDAAGFAAELARVLAPEGIALVFGFNPFGAWRPWVMRQQRRNRIRLRLQSAQAVRELLARESIDTLQVRFPGLLWPGAGVQTRGESDQQRPWSRWGSSWMLIARKRTSTLTPLRLRAGAREAALKPHLAASAHRECA
jgi:SAM-dependent methyltransferase